MARLKKLLSELIDGAKFLGLPERDLENARENLKYNEFELCFEIITVQMYEFDIKIDEHFYQLIEKAGQQMSLASADYVFMKELLTTGGKD